MLVPLFLLLLAPEVSPGESEAKAEQALREGKIAEALASYEDAIREADDTPTKLRLRDLYIAAGWTEPRPTSAVEDARLAAFINEEKMRVFGAAADRFERDDRIQAAILMHRVLTDLAGGEDTDRGKAEVAKVRALDAKLTHK